MRYLSCRADSSFSTCRSISVVVLSFKPTTPKIKVPTSQMTTTTMTSPPQSPSPHQNSAPVRPTTTTSPSPTPSSSLPLTTSLPPPSLTAAPTTPSSGSASATTATSPSLSSAPPQPLPPPCLQRGLQQDRDPLPHLLLSPLQPPRLRPHPLLPAPPPCRQFMSKDTLFGLLHSSSNPSFFPCHLHIALQTAHAILTLQSASPYPIIHHNVKSANVRLADNGLALRLPNNSQKSDLPYDGDVIPPAGYLDPSYVTSEDLEEGVERFD